MINRRSQLKTTNRFILKSIVDGKGNYQESKLDIRETGVRKKSEA